MVVLFLLYAGTCYPVAMIRNLIRSSALVQSGTYLEKEDI